MKKTDIFAKRTNQTQSIKQTAAFLFSQYSQLPPFRAALAKYIWEQTMGASVITRTLSLRIEEKTLFVKLNSAPLRSELISLQQQIIDKFNELSGFQLIEKIKLQ